MDITDDFDLIFRDTIQDEVISHDEVSYTCMDIGA
jgi:hypothetical protein